MFPQRELVEIGTKTGPVVLDDGTSFSSQSEPLFRGRGLELDREEETERNRVEEAHSALRFFNKRPSRGPLLFLAGEEVLREGPQLTFLVDPKLSVGVSLLGLGAKWTRRAAIIFCCILCCRRFLATLRNFFFFRSSLLRSLAITFLRESKCVNVGGACLRREELVAVFVAQCFLEWPMCELPSSLRRRGPTCDVPSGRGAGALAAGLPVFLQARVEPL